VKKIIFIIIKEKTSSVFILRDCYKLALSRNLYEDIVD